MVCIPAFIPCADWQFAKVTGVDEETVHSLIGKHANGRSLRRLVKKSIGATLPNICATVTQPMMFSERFGEEYDDFDFTMRDVAALMVLMVCDPANRCLHLSLFALRFTKHGRYRNVLECCCAAFLW